MDDTSAAEAAPVVLVAVVGPQASGKSTLSTALGAELRRAGEQVAVVELDRIAEMALPTLPGWDVAHEIYGDVTARWLRSGLSCVVAEGGGSAAELADLVAVAPDDAVVVTVATTAPFDVALARAQADPTRGVSKQHDYLRRVYDAWPAQLAAAAPQLTIDTDAVGLSAAVDLVRRAIADARAAQPTTR